MPTFQEALRRARASSRVMRYQKSLSVAADDDPVYLGQLKTHLRIEHGEEDADLQGYLSAAINKVHEMTNRVYLTSTYAFTYDRFPTSNFPFMLPLAPVQSITSITYVDSNGITQTVSESDYELKSGVEPCEIHPAYNVYWPIARLYPGSVTVTVVCGYEDEDSIPEQLKLAIKMLAGHYYENREETTALIGGQVLPIPMGVHHLIVNLRVRL